MNPSTEVNVMPYWVDLIVKLTPAFITFVIGVVGSTIAYRQYRLSTLQHQLNQNRLRLDLFSKRLEAYEKLQEFLSSVARTGTVEDKSLPVLGEALYQSRFLFGDEISSRLDETWKRAVDMRYCRQMLHETGSLPVGPKRTDLCEKDSELLKWMMNEMNEAPARYAKYLKFQ
jgi:hypothetical protein